MTFDLTRWRRDDVLRHLNARLWRYLSENAQPNDLPAVVETFFGLGRGELRELTATHLALSKEVTRALSETPQLLRELPTTVQPSDVELVGTVRGRVDWQRTMRRRWATGDPRIFNCRPVGRRYDTPVARLLKLFLRWTSELAQLAGMRDIGATGRVVANVSRAASTYLRHHALLEVADVDDVPERVLVRLEVRPRVAGVVRAVRAMRDALELGSPRAVREVVEGRILAPTGDDQLFELLVGFEIVDSFLSEGYVEAATPLVPGRAPFATLGREASTVTVWWQRSLWDVEADGSFGRFAAALAAAGMSRSALRPDFLVRSNNPSRLLLVETKFTARQDMTPDRQGLREMLAYLDDASDALAGLPTPHGLVVAWNSEGRPSSHRVIVTSPRRVDEAIHLTGKEWRASAGMPT